MKRPSPSMAVALVALFVALGGTATAAKVLITNSSQLKAGVVKRTDIAKSAVDSTRVADGSLTTSDLDSATQSALAQSGTQAIEAFRAKGPNDVEANKEAVVATLADVPPGSYALFGKANLSATSSGGVFGGGTSVSGSCRLEVGDNLDKSFALLGAPGASANATVHMQITKAFESPGTVKVVCVAGATWSAGGTSIIALRVAPPSRNPVEGR